MRGFPAHRGRGCHVKSLRSAISRLVKVSSRSRTVGRFRMQLTPAPERVHPTTAPPGHAGFGLPRPQTEARMCVCVCVGGGTTFSLESPRGPAGNGQVQGGGKGGATGSELLRSQRPTGRSRWATPRPRAPRPAPRSLPPPSSTHPDFPRGRAGFAFPFRPLTEIRAGRGGRAHGGGGPRAGRPDGRGKGGQRAGRGGL